MLHGVGSFAIVFSVIDPFSEVFVFVDLVGDTAPTHQRLYESVERIRLSPVRSTRSITFWL